jgi:hypothetical protein
LPSSHSGSIPGLNKPVFPPSSLTVSGGPHPSPKCSNLALSLHP